MPKVLISTVGIGSRLYAHTKHKNKALVSLNNKPVISHQIDYFDDNVEFVIALGYKGSLVRDYLELAHPNKNFIFQEVEPFEGDGASLGLSLTRCREHLQEPFIFLSCDTIVNELIPNPDSNWIGYCRSSKSSASYRTIALDNLDVIEILEKGSKPTTRANVQSFNYIGLCGIHNYDLFWEAYNSISSSLSLQGEAVGLRALVTKSRLTARPFTWFDTGNIDALKSAKAHFVQDSAPNILIKEDEDIWFTHDSVIKFFADPAISKKRVLRANNLSGFTPTILSSKASMYLYKKLSGKILSECIDVPLFRKFLDFSSYFWGDFHHIQSSKEFKRLCHKFYHDKTLERVRRFQDKYPILSNEVVVNGIHLPTTEDQLNLLDWDELCDGIPVRFHGDYHFENILYDEDTDKFMLLDWRQDFADDLENGDIYYDLAKMLHGLIVNHEYVALQLYSVQSSDTNNITIDIHQRLIYSDCIGELESWCDQNYLSFYKVRILCALIFLNISPLHHHPYSVFLHLLGKKMLSEIK